MSTSPSFPPEPIDPAATLPASAGWSPVRWHGEAAWRAAEGSVLAVVSEQRQRLVYLGALEGGLNLLNAPPSPAPPSAQQPWPNQGGHRFWLGPQKTWVWPPLTEWEYSAAQAVRLAGDMLVLQQPRLNPAYPAITREYAWHDGRLRCTARWEDPHGRFFGMHIVPVDVPMTGGGELVRARTVPLGVVQVLLDSAAGEGFLPHPAIALESTRATIRSGEKVIKLGFSTQPLAIRRAQGWQLSVLPGPPAGAVVDFPDQGYLSQIWVGGPEYDFAELEQLSPFLRSDPTGDCASTIFLCATGPLNA